MMSRMPLTPGIFASPLAFQTGLLDYAKVKELRMVYYDNMVNLDSN